MVDISNLATNQQLDEDTAKDIQEDLQESDEDVTKEMRLAAGSQLVVLFVAAAVAIVFAVMTGIITPSITVTASINIAWIIEYLVIAISAAFILYIFALLIIVLPGSVLNLLGGLAYGAATAAGLVETNSGGNEEG